MSKIAIVTDSTACIPAELVSRYRITVLPQVLIWGDQTYEDGIDISADEFYTRLKTAKTMPSTSQVSIAHMARIFNQLVEHGYSVLGMFLSAKLSGTIQSAMQGREEMVIGKDKVEIFDTRTTIMAMGFQILQVARAAQDGASLADCKAIAEKHVDSSKVYFAVDTLEFLHRGGRIGGAQRFLGSALNLKPILTVQDGKVEAVERIRTKAKAHDRLIEIVLEHVKGKSKVRVAAQHANAAEDAQALLEKLGAQIEIHEKIISGVSPVIGTHTGPGTVALAYFCE